MMQSRQQYGSSGELDVFGATCYFAGGLADRTAVTAEHADRLIQLKMTHEEKKVEESFRAPHHRHEQLEEPDMYQQAQLGAKANKSKLAAFFSFMVSPSPVASFRKEPPPISRPVESDEPSKVSSSTSRVSRDVTVTAASMQGCGHDLDLGVVMGDRRLQGVRVVRGSSGEERWVVKCGAWEEELHEKIVDAATSSDHHDQVEEGEDGKACNWESDSSSDLFDLDL